MACRLIGAKPLPELLPTFWRVGDILFSLCHTYQTSSRMGDGAKRMRVISIYLCCVLTAKFRTKFSRRTIRCFMSLHDCKTFIYIVSGSRFSHKTTICYFECHVTPYVACWTQIFVASMLRTRYFMAFVEGGLPLNHYIKARNDLT